MTWVRKFKIILLLSLSSFLNAHGSSIFRTKDLSETYSSIPSTDAHRTEECDCGVYGVCHFENGLKKCECAHLTDEFEGQCIECDCGENANHCYFKTDGTKVCYCKNGYIYVNGKCTECFCGYGGVCKLESGKKKCICGPGFIEIDGECVERESTSSEVLTRTTSFRTTDVPSTTQFCDCGKYSKSCRYTYWGIKVCDCFPGFVENYGTCDECNCGPYGSCSFESGRKRCNCESFAVEKYGVCVKRESTTSEVSTSFRTTDLPTTTRYCSCGYYSKSCEFDWWGSKICDCYPGFVENNGICDECNCGPYGSCSFESGRKRCKCKSFAFEKNGLCVERESTPSEISTSFRTTVLPSTIRDCDCGPFGRCVFENGRKKCICNFLTSEKNGKCVECDCGENTKSCHFDWKGDKACNCTSGYVEVYGICKVCNCGANARHCFFRENGIKDCSCDFGYIETNGYCSAICNEDKCINGKCEIVGNGFTCRCNKGFTGQRCEEKILTKSNKQNLWMVLQLSVAFAIFIVLSCMFCFLTRALNKMSRK